MRIKRFNESLDLDKIQKLVSDTSFARRIDKEIEYLCSSLEDFNLDEITYEKFWYDSEYSKYQSVQTILDDEYKGDVFYVGYCIDINNKFCKEFGSDDLVFGIKDFTDDLDDLKSTIEFINIILKSLDDVECNILYYDKVIEINIIDLKAKIINK